VAAQYDKQLPVRDATAFKAEVRRWAAKIGVQPKRVQIQCMTTKWASCSPAGRICFNGDLLSEDAAFQQVVIVHELLHLLVPNHGKLFRSLMAAYVPGWEQMSGPQITRCQ
jgi:predicted metal-dependent hydrolase